MYRTTLISGRFIIIVIAVVLAAPSVASASMWQFVPKISDFSADAETDLLHQDQKNTSNGQGAKTSDTVITEQVNLSAWGYIYHPKFVSLFLRLSGGLEQEKFSLTGTRSPWTVSSVREYELRAYVLPDHPYNLELYTLRSSSFVTGGFQASSIKPVTTQSGALFHFKERPWYLDTGYFYNTTESAGYASEAHGYTLSGSYTRQNVSQSLSYAHTDGSSTQTKSTLNSFSAGNRLYTLSSDFNITTFKQTNSTDSPGLDSKTLAWTELLDIPLPWNFSSNARYDHREDTMTTEEIASSPRTKTENLTNNASFNLSHHLFKSLATSYMYNYLFLKSPGGESEAKNSAITVNYTKKITAYNSLSTGVGVVEGTTDRTGSAAITETHTAALGATILLGAVDVDEATIVVRVKNPDTSVFYDLHSPTDYTLLPPLGNVHRLQLALVLPSLPPNFPTGRQTYDFLISYALTGGSVKLKNTSFTYNLRMDLFDHFLSPYYSFLRSRQKVLSGFLEGGADSADAHTAGLVAQKGPWFLMGEFQDYKSEKNPFKAFRSELGWRKPVTPTTDLNTQLDYSTTLYPKGLSTPATAVTTGTARTIVKSYTENTYGVTVQLRKSFMDRSLKVALQGRYAHKTGLINSDVYSLGSSAIWRVGKLAFSLEGNSSFATSRSALTRNEQVNNNLFLRITRKLT